MTAATATSTARVGRRLAPLYASAFTGGITLWVPDVVGQSQPPESAVN